jgi:hypothetical protein
MKHSLLLLATITAAGIVPSANASACASTTDCTYTFDEHNSGSTGFTTSGPFGTVELTLSGGNINVTLDVLSTFNLIDTGFAGTFGFNDNLELGDITAGSFSSGLYSGSANNGGVDSHPGGDLNYDGFGFFDDAAATTGPSAGNANAVSHLTFTISRPGGFSSIQQLVELNSGGDGNAYFVADVFDTNCGSSTNTACTGLIGVSSLNSPVPEPVSSGLVGIGLIALSLLRRRTSSSCK